MIEGLIIFTGGLMFGVFMNIILVLKNQTFHSERIDELEKKIDCLLVNFKNKQKL